MLMGIFRAGNQDCRADEKFKGPEFAAAGNILQGFAPASSSEQFPEMKLAVLIYRLIMEEKESAAGNAQAVA